MKRNLLISLLMVSALFALNSCKKEYLVEVKGTVNGNIREYYTNQPLSNVLVRLIVNDQTTLKDSTDASGYYSISGVPSGYYPVIFSKSGYASVRGYVQIESPDEVSNTTNGKKQSYSYGTISNGQLSPLTGKIDGLVILNDDGSPAANATVVVSVDDGYSTYISNTLEPASYTTTTDANGRYSFSNLPIGFDITCTAYSGNSSGSTSTSLGFAQSITPKYLADIAIDDEKLYLVNYTGKGSTSIGDGFRIDTTVTSIVLTFSENVSEALTKGKGGYVKLSVGSADVLCSVAYSGATVTITLPAGTLSSNNTYTIEYNVYATEIKSASGTPTFTTKERPALIATTVANLAFADPNFNVTNLPAITGMPTGQLLDFDVYFKSFAGDQMDFRIITSGISITGNTTQRVIAKSGGFAPGQYYVVPKVEGLDGVMVYGVPSNVAIRPN